MQPRIYLPSPPTRLPLPWDHGLHDTSISNPSPPRPSHPINRSNNLFGKCFNVTKKDDGVPEHEGPEDGGPEDGGPEDLRTTTMVQERTGGWQMDDLRTTMKVEEEGTIATGDGYEQIVAKDTVVLIAEYV